MKEVLKFDLTDELVENNERHILQCKLIHTPDECDYSHIEILIRHRIIESNGNIRHDEVYSYKDWVENKALLKKNKSK